MPDGNARSAVDAAPTRLPPPRWDPGRGLISRERLLERLEGTARCPLLLIVAPAGYGKTTLLSEWDAADPRPFAWVTIDARDNDPAFFARTLAGVLDEIEPVGEDVFDLLGAARPGLPASLIPRLVAAVAARQEPCVLVLDEFDVVEDEQSLELVSALAAALPEGSQLTVAARSQPGLRLGRLRAEGGLAEFGPQVLSMTRGEIAAVLDLAGVELGPAALRELADHTEGWPVAVHVAGRAVVDEPDPDGAIGRLAGDDRVMADYLREELVAAVDPDDRTLLTECSILDGLNGDACDALLARQGSAADLRRLSRGNLLLIPLDRADREFRYHRLFREMLLAELERGGGERISALHLRASAFYAERGDTDRAIEHAIASRDDAAAGALLWRHCPDYVSHGRAAGIAAWLDRIGEERIAASPALALTHATISLTTGDGADIDARTASALEGLEGPDGDERRSLEVGAHLIRTSGGTTASLEEGLRAAGDARSLLPEDSPWRSLACFIEGTAHYLGGARDAAIAALTEGARRGDRAVPTVRSLCLTQHAILLLDGGFETEAWGLEEHAAATVQRHGIGDQPTLALVIATSALIRARRGRVNDAVVASRHAVALLASLPGTSAWYEAETRVVLARALVQLDDLAGARRCLEEAERYLPAAGASPVLTEMFAAARRAVDAQDAGDRWPLTPAELRLLHLLPTHYSFREIAAQLYVSTNTVKSQARSIYRKLGVASRAEAISAAQAGGLIATGPAGAGPADVRTSDRTPA